MGPRTDRKTPARSTSRRRRKKGAKRIPVVRLGLVLSLLAFLLFTVGAVGYVIFFRTVLA